MFAEDTYKEETQGMIRFYLLSIELYVARELKTDTSDKKLEIVEKTAEIIDGLIEDLIQWEN